MAHQENDAEVTKPRWRVVINEMFELWVEYHANMVKHRLPPL